MRAIDFSHTGTQSTEIKEIVPMIVAQNFYPVISNTTMILTQVLLIWIQMTPPMDGFVEHSYEVLFVPDDDIEQVS